MEKAFLEITAFGNNMETNPLEITQISHPGKKTFLEIRPEKTPPGKGLSGKSFP